MRGSGNENRVTLRKKNLTMEAGKVIKIREERMKVNRRGKSEAIETKVIKRLGD